MRLRKLWLAGTGLLAASHNSKRALCDDVGRPGSAFNTSKVAPQPKKIPHKMIVDGRTLEDNYYWLRQKTSKEVLSHLEAENDYSNGVMEPYKDLQEQVYNELRGRVVEEDKCYPYKEGEFFYYWRTEAGKGYRVFCRSKTVDGDEEILLNENEMAEGKDFFKVRVKSVSPNGKILAFSKDEDGSERWSLEFKDLETGEQIGEVVKDMSGFAWVDDDTYVYTKQNKAWRPYCVISRKVSCTGSERVVFEDKDEKHWVWVDRSRQGTVIIGSDSEDTHEKHFLTSADGPLQVIQPRVEGLEYEVDVHEGKFYILTNADNATNFKLMEAPMDNPGKENWVEVIGHDEDITLESFNVFSNHIVLSERNPTDVKPMLRILNLKTGEQNKLSFPEDGYGADAYYNREFDTDKVRVLYSSMKTPSTTFDYDMNTLERETLMVKEVPNFDPDRYIQERTWAISHDGVRIPITLLRLRDVPVSPETPVHLYGYGSYGINVDADFDHRILPIVDRGVIFAYAHIRGGGEGGRSWKNAGKMHKKINTFLDFCSCADHLIYKGYTSAGRIVAEGRSAGGMLMGAIVNMRPELFAGILTGVPFVDVVNTMLDASIPLTTNEWEQWGNPYNPEDLEYMMKWSPYDNIERKPYPAIWANCGLNDTRVQYWEAAKWVAKMREYATDSSPKMLKTIMDSGHGGASSRYKKLKERALDYTFVLAALGVQGPPVQYCKDGEIK